MEDSDEYDYEDSDYEDDGPMFTEDEDLSNRKKDKCQRWTVLDNEHIKKMEDKALASVQEMLGCDRSTARVLLLHYRWNTESLFGALADRDTEDIYKAAGVLSRAADAGTSTSSSGLCEVCYSEDDPRNFTQMSCGHAFCNNCWRRHCQICITEGKAKKIPCMAPKCGAVCADDKVEKILWPLPVLLEKMKQVHLDSFVDDNQAVCWCPSVPHCGRALQVEGDTYCEPQCSCGVSFCFNCLSEPHSPCTCEMWQQWRQKSQDDSETKNWLTANTKPCPKCSKPVEKNGGCNLVVCHCGQAFCWLCGASTGRDHTWTSIAGHECGRYKEDLDKKITDAQRLIKRFLHYDTRYQAHMQSLKMEQKQTDAINDNIRQMEDSASSLKDYTWLTKALDQLFVARRVLGYSYIFAFYMFGNDMFKDEISTEQNGINQNLFEDQQTQLEQQVERLSMLIETPPVHMDDQVRLQVINCAVNIDQRLMKLYEVIENDLLGRLQFSANYIAPYKGQASQHGDANPYDMDMGAGPSGSALHVEDSSFTGQGKGKALAGHGKRHAGVASPTAKAKQPCIDLSMDD